MRPDPQGKMQRAANKIAAWVRQSGLTAAETHEDLLADSVPDSVEFNSDTPAFTGSNSLRSFSQLDDAWIRRHIEPIRYECALSLVNNSSVVLLGVESTRLVGQICDEGVFRAQMEINSIGMLCTCSCEGHRLITDRPGVDPISCAHVAAIAIYVVTNGLLPPLSAGERGAVCPITRQPIEAAGAIFKCERCQMCYSELGWQFLVKMDRGACCNCHARNSIHVIRSGSDEKNDAS